MCLNRAVKTSCNTQAIYLGACQIVSCDFMNDYLIHQHQAITSNKILNFIWLQTKVCKHYEETYLTDHETIMKMCM